MCCGRKTETLDQILSIHVWITEYELSEFSLRFGPLTLCPPTAYLSPAHQKLREGSLERSRPALSPLTSFQLLTSDDREKENPILASSYLTPHRVGNKGKHTCDTETAGDNNKVALLFLEWAERRAAKFQSHGTEDSTLVTQMTH